jgi:hypothetical protein
VSAVFRQGFKDACASSWDRCIAGRKSWQEPVVTHIPARADKG